MQNYVTKGTDSKNRICNCQSDFAVHNSRKGVWERLILDKLLHLQSQVCSFVWGLIVSFSPLVRIVILLNITTPLIFEKHAKHKRHVRQGK